MEKKEHILDVYRKSLIAKEELKQKKEEIKEEVLSEIHPNREFDKQVHVPPPPEGVSIISVVGTVEPKKSPTISEITQEDRNKRLHQLAAERKRKIAVGALETG